MIIFTLDVLALPGDGIGQRQPSPEGKRLWDLFAKQHKGQMVLVAPQTDSPEHLDHWLKVERVKPDLEYRFGDTTPRSKYEAASKLRASFGKVDWFLDTDPATVLHALDEGIPSLLVVTAHVARPDWRTRQRSSWEDLVERIEEEAYKRAENRVGHHDD